MAEAQSAQQHIPEIVREEAEEDEQTGSLYSEGTRDSSKSVQLQQLEHHRHSPLDELIEDLGGRRKSSVATDDTSSHAEPTPHASPLMHGWPSSISDQYRAPPLASLSEEDTDENDLETSSDVTAEAAVEAAHQKLRDSLMLPSAWSNTNSVRSSGETHLSSNAHNEELEHAAATASPSLPFEESPNDPLNQSQFPPNFLADALNVSTSTNASEIRRRSTQAVPTSLPLKDFPASSDSTQTSHTSQRTPKTSRRWSIVEMEQAYSRMRQLFASNASFNRSVLESSLGASSEDQFNTTETPKPDQRDFLNDAPQKPKQNDVGYVYVKITD